MIDGVLEDFDLGKEDALDRQPLLHKELVELAFEGFLDFVAAVRDVFALDLGKDVADAGAGVGPDDFTNKIIADILPELGSVTLVDLKKNRAFDANALVILGGSEDGLVSEGLFIIDVKAVADGVLENLGVKELGDLPERDLEVEAGAPDLLEDAVATIIDAGDMAGGNGDKETTNNLINEETND